MLATKPWDSGLQAGVEFTDRGLLVHRDLSHEDWMALGMELSRRHRANAWYVGDWWNAHKGELSGQELIAVLDALELDLKTVRNLASICAAYPLEERWPELTISHHRAVVALPPEVRREFLRQAAEEGLSLRELEARVQAWRKRETRRAVKERERERERPEEKPSPGVFREREKSEASLDDLYRAEEAWEEEDFGEETKREAPGAKPSPLPPLPFLGNEIVVDGDAVECRGYPESRVKIAPDGRLFLWHPSARLTPQAARALAQALLAAADLVERGRQEVAL